MDTTYKIVSLMSEKSMTLSVAESCTGGLLANRITDVSGSSAVFLTGVVSYSNQSKINILHVNKDDLEEHGAVSEVVSREMAGGIRKISGSNIGIGVTGIAGPDGGSPHKPVGTVYYSIDINGKSFTKLLNLTGSRREIKENTVKEVLSDLLSILKKTEL